MHELAITEEIVEAVRDRLAPGERVSRVVLEIGKLSTVLPDAVRFCFDVCCEGTALEGARLEIREVMGAGRCRECGAEVEMARPLERCGCGSCSLEWVRGEELRVVEMEVR
jgi:hydrogenase nickel incorporation protein HypA/HybF